MNLLQQKIYSAVESATNSNKKFTVDYFSWGRDKRHMVDNTEKMPSPDKAKIQLKKILRSLHQKFWMRKIKGIDRYALFDDSYQLMSDEYSKNLFVELLAMQILGEEKMHLSSFTDDLIASYESASDELLESSDELNVYKWILKKTFITNPPLSFYTSPETLNIAHLNRLYCYKRGKALVDISEGDNVIDAGIGWGDSVVYLAAKAVSDSGGMYYAFDINQESASALSKQLALNPRLTNVSYFLKALSNTNGDLYISEESSPGSRVENTSTSRCIESIKIDTFIENQQCTKIDFIKMDIEGSEIPALIGAQETIKKYKPKMAISVYHKWDDLHKIPLLINSMRADYEFYLDCTTGFGGETILYCR